MASALPQAIGAAVPSRSPGIPHRETGAWPCSWATCFLQQLEVPVKLVVFRNDALAFVELE
jgi:hypothetical protein